MLPGFLRELLLPPSNLILLFVLGLFIRRSYPIAARFLRGGALVGLFILSTALGARPLVFALESLAPPLTQPGAARAEAIVVLSAGHYARAPEYDGRDVPDYLGLARLRYAAKLHRETGLPVLVSGGVAGGDPRNQAEAVSMAAVLEQEFGVPVRWMEKNSRNTAENASFSARILRQEGVRRVLLVTDALHVPRAVLSFAAHDMDPVPAPTIFRGRSEITWVSLIPSAENLRRSYYAFYEALGLAGYWLKYRLSEKPTLFLAA